MSMAGALIISGGENIDPRRIESVLERHPAVTECVVVGRSDDEWANVPSHLWMVSKPETSKRFRNTCTVTNSLQKFTTWASSTKRHGKN